MGNAQVFANMTSSDNPLLAIPESLRLSCEATLNSVRLTQFFRVPLEPEWVDEAPMRLRSRGQVRVRLTGVRRMEFCSVGDEFQDKD